MIRLAAAGCAALALAVAAAHAQEELLGAPDDGVRFLSRSDEPSKPKAAPSTSAKRAVEKPAKEKKPVAKTAPKATAKLTARPLKDAPKVAAVKPPPAKTEKAATAQARPRSSAPEVEPRELAQAEPPPPPRDEIYDGGDHAHEQDHDVRAAIPDDARIPSQDARGQTAGFFAEPRFEGRRIFVDYYYFRGAPRRAEEASTDDFCRRMGYRRGAYYSLVRTPDGEALEDVLCLR